MEIQSEREISRSHARTHSSVNNRCGYSVGFYLSRHSFQAKIDCGRNFAGVVWRKTKTKVEHTFSIKWSLAIGKCGLCSRL